LAWAWVWLRQSAKASDRPMTARCNASTEPRKVVTGGATSPLPDSPLLDIVCFFRAARTLPLPVQDGEDAAPPFANQEKITAR